MTEDLRLQYSGFIIFAAKLVSVATGLIFQLMLARAIILSDEYDVWFNVNDVLTYFTLLSAVVPFWVLRFVARKKEGAIKTGIVANLIIAFISIMVYLPLVSLITSAPKIGEKYVFLYGLVSLQILEVYFMNIFENCLRAKTPHVIGYGLIISELMKVILGYVLIVEFQQPLLGALLSIIVGLAIQTSYYFNLLREELKQKVKWEYIKEWIRGSLATIYNVVGNQIAAFIFIILFIYGGDGGRSRYGLAAFVANVITYSSFLAFALYPKLMRDRKHEDITASLKMVLMFAIPMTAGAIVLAESYIVIMRTEYVDAQYVLMVLAADALVATISVFFSSVLTGVETVDEKAKISIKELLKSRLFVLFSLPYIHSAIALPSAYYVLANYAQNQPFQAAFYVSIINASARLAMFFVLYAIVRKMIQINIPWKNIAKYIFASAVMVAILLLLPRPERIALTLAMTALGGIIYLTLLVAIDGEARSLIKTVWQEIRLKVKRTPLRIIVP